MREERRGGECVENRKRAAVTNTKRGQHRERRDGERNVLRTERVQQSPIRKEGST
jgi:hypothetical protein